MRKSKRNGKQDKSKVKIIDQKNEKEKEMNIQMGTEYR